MEEHHHHDHHHDHQYDPDAKPPYLTLVILLSMVLIGVALVVYFDMVDG